MNSQIGVEVGGILVGVAVGGMGVFVAVGGIGVGVSIDPKGIKHTDYMHKVDGYKTIFEEDDGRIRKFEFKDLTARVYTFLRADDINRLPQNGYRKYWFDNINEVLNKIFIDVTS